MGEWQNCATLLYRSSAYGCFFVCLLFYLSVFLPFICSSVHRSSVRCSSVRCYWWGLLLVVRLLGVGSSGRCLFVFSVLLVVVSFVRLLSVVVFVVYLFVVGSRYCGSVCCRWCCLLFAVGSVVCLLVVYCW